MNTNHLDKLLEFTYALVNVKMNKDDFSDDIKTKAQAMSQAVVDVDRKSQVAVDALLEDPRVQEIHAAVAARLAQEGEPLCGAAITSALLKGDTSVADVIVRREEAKATA